MCRKGCLEQLGKGLEGYVQEGLFRTAVEGLGRICAGRAV